MSQFLHDERTWGVLAGGAAIWILWSRDDQDQISVDASDRTVAVQAKSRAASPSSPSFPSSPNAGPHFDSVLVCPGMQGSAINSAGQFSASNPSIFVSNSVVEIVVSSVLRFFHFLHDTFKAAQKAAMLIVASRTPQKNLRQGRRRSISCPVRPLRNIFRRLWRDFQARLSSDQSVFAVSFPTLLLGSSKASK